MSDTGGEIQAVGIVAGNSIDACTSITITPHEMVAEAVLITAGASSFPFKELAEGLYMLLAMPGGAACIGPRR